MCGPGPTPMAIAVKLEIPPGQTRRKHTWSVVLVDDNGEPVLLPADGQKSTVAIHGEIERIRDPKSAPPEEPVNLRFAVNITPLPLESGSSYAGGSTSTTRLAKNGRSLLVPDQRLRSRAD